MPKKPPSVELEVRHYALVLRQLIRAAGLSVSEVERRLGQGPKSLRRVFGGQVDLKFKHAISVLQILDVPQEKFFEMVAQARRKKRRSSTADILKAFETMGYRGDFTPMDEDDMPPPPEGFDRLVEDTVKRVVERLERERGEREGRPAPPDPRNQGTGDLGGEDEPRPEE
jgi:transcriptional regulator with XRE-family HTH domain